MQYYKLVAKEVESRISKLKPFLVDSDSDSSEDNTDAPDLPESEQNYELPSENLQHDCDVSIDRITSVESGKREKRHISSSQGYYASDECKSVKSNGSHQTAVSPPLPSSPKLVIDLNLNINDRGRDSLNSPKSRPCISTVELPERDCNTHPRTVQKELLLDIETDKKSEPKKKSLENSVHVVYSHHNDDFSDPGHSMHSEDGPSSLNSKSFTGSLNDLHTDCIKETHQGSKLIRQQSYTLLKPSPQLLAHLKVQSHSTGVEMQSISMSESLSNLSSPNKKRRSWDLETAKVKWSSMALELKSNVANGSRTVSANRNIISRFPNKKASTSSPLRGNRAKSASLEKSQPPSWNSKISTMSEPIQSLKRTYSPIKNNASNTDTNTVSDKCTMSSVPKTDALVQKPDEDPATRVRELYEKVQKQQIVQMANLVEKQRKEQMLLQQVFEEQNNLLFSQLKTICPKSPIEAKEAWVDKSGEDVVERGPVSLSQLIKTKTDNSSFDSPISSTLTDTSNYLSHCDDVLKKSRDITDSIKKQLTHTSTQGIVEAQSHKTLVPDSKSTGAKMRSRKLNYDTSASSDRDNEPILTDRTNDTLADLNVTFPSDHSDDGRSMSQNDQKLNRKDVPTVLHSPPPLSVGSAMSTEAAIRSMEQAIYKSSTSAGRHQTKLHTSQPSIKEVSFTYLSLGRHLRE